MYEFDQFGQFGMEIVLHFFPRAPGLGAAPARGRAFWGKVKNHRVRGRQRASKGVKGRTVEFRVDVFRSTESLQSQRAESRVVSSEQRVSARGGSGGSRDGCGLCPS